MPWAMPSGQVSVQLWEQVSVKLWEQVSVRPSVTA